MNILLDAFFDGNFGDDLFIRYITGRLPKVRFYAFLEYYPEKIRRWAETIPNLYLLPQCEVFLHKNIFDGYICVGGDIFPDGGDYTQRKAYVRSVREGNGKIAFLGFSMFRQYGEQTKADLREILGNADLIAPRDAESAGLLRELLPDKPILRMADLAFSMEWGGKRPEQKNGILGISVRRPDYASETDMDHYCRGIAQAAERYLEGDASRRVRIFVLSDGTASDRETADRVIASLSAPERAEREIYAGNGSATLDKIRECDAVICTRLHAMIASIAMGIPFLPIVYEVKMEQILAEIQFDGPGCSFQTAEQAADLLDKLLADDAREYAEDALHNYLKLSDAIGERLDELFAMPADAVPVRKADATDAVCSEKEYARQQAEMVLQKNRELEENGEKLRWYEGKVEECRTLIEQYLKTIAESQTTIEEYLRTIEELKETNQSYLGTIEELKETNQSYLGTIEELKETNQSYLRTIEELKETNQSYFSTIEEVNNRNQEYFHLIEELNQKLYGK